MAKFQFQKAVKSKEKLRLALDGPAGAGKTWTALTIGSYLATADGGRVAVIDSERSSARKYAGDFDFDHLTLPDFDPTTYRDAIRSAIEAGYAVIVIDSLSHAWEGTLDMKDRVQKRSISKDGFGAWREVTPVHNELVDTILRAPAHIIATMRTKTEYSVDKDENGKTKITRLGLKPQQREGVEYEFDVVGDMDVEHNLIVSKSRCSALADAVINRPGEHLAKTLDAWLNEGEATVTETEAAELTAALNAIADEQTRRETKARFKATFGLPSDVLSSRLPDAVSFIEQALAPPAPAAPRADAAFEEPDDPADDGAMTSTQRRVIHNYLTTLRDEPAAAALEAIEAKWASIEDLTQEQAAEVLHTIQDGTLAPVSSETPPDKMTEAQKKHIFALVHELGIDELHEARLQYASEALGRKVDTFTSLTEAEADRLIACLEEDIETEREKEAAVAAG